MKNKRYIQFRVNADILAESLNLFSMRYYKKLDDKHINLSGLTKALLLEYIGNPEYYNDKLDFKTEKITYTDDDFRITITDVFKKGLLKFSKIPLGLLIQRLFELYVNSPESFPILNDGEYVPKFSWLIDGKVELLK